MTRYHFASILLGLYLLAAVHPAAANLRDPMIFGVVPYVTAKEIIETYRPLARSLEKQLNRRVFLYTARDFKTFAARTRKGEYDLLLTVPHLAWLAREEANYLPLLEYSHPVFGLLVVRDDAPYDSIADLRGQTIAAAAPIGLVVLATQTDLAVRGLRPEADYQSANAITHVNAAMHVVNKRTAAAILAMQPYSAMSPEFRSQLRILHRTDPLPGMIYLTHPRLDTQESGAVRDALVRFATSAEGREFLQRGNHGSLKPVTSPRLNAMEPFARQAKTHLEPPQ